MVGTLVVKGLMTWRLPNGNIKRTASRIFFIKVQSQWDGQLMLHVMRTLKQFSNGSRKKQKFTLLEKSIKKMVDLAGSKENAYSIKWMKKKLKDRYKEHLSFLAADGKMTKIYFKDMTDYLLNEKQ